MQLASWMVGILLIPTVLPASGLASATEVEVLHYWTSRGEARAVETLKQALESRGDSWKDFAVAGGAGENAIAVLKSRVVSGNPPTAAQLKGPDIQELAAQGSLGNIDRVARANNWDALLPAVVARQVRYQGHYVAAPVDIHRLNWLWINPQVFRKAGADVPKTWDDLLLAADRIRKAGFIAVAHGGQPWQDFTLFESVVLGTGGADFYRKALVELDPATLNSATMIKAFETFRALHRYVDKDAPNREWNRATDLVAEGRAGMQFMGDWAAGELSAAGRKPGRDYLCILVPGTAAAYTFSVDSLAMFAPRNADARKGQDDLAAAVMDVSFQELFNLRKGSIPVRMGIDLAKFDVCARQSARDFSYTSRSGGLLPSIAQGMAVPAATAAAMQDVITEFFNGDVLTPRSAAGRLASAARIH